MIVALFDVISEKYDTYMLNIDYLLKFSVLLTCMLKMEEEVKSSERINKIDPDILLIGQAKCMLPQTQNLEIICSAAAYPWRHQKPGVFEFLLTETYSMLSAH